MKKNPRTTSCRPDNLVPYYQDESATIYHGDCLDVLGKLESSGARIDGVITDPPYASGARTVTWPGSVRWAAATAPTLTTTASRVDIITFVTMDEGTKWYGFVAAQDFVG